MYPFTNKALRGQDFNFSCQVPGNGISIKWLKNGIDVPNYQTYRQPTKTLKGLTFNENILMLKKVSWVDAANYTCVVTTSQQPGYSNNKTTELFVKGTVQLCMLIYFACVHLCVFKLFSLLGFTQSWLPKALLAFLYPVPDVDRLGDWQV